MTAGTRGRPSALRRAVQRSLPEPVIRVAGTVLGRTMDRLAVPPPGLRAGRDAGPGDRVPAVLVLHLGAPSAQAVEATVRALADAGTGRRTARPVLVLDSTHLAVARRAGFAVEHLLPAQAWARRFPGVPYAEYLAERLTQLERDYATRQLVVVPPQGPLGLEPGMFAAALEPPRRGRWRRGWQGVAGRAEALIDRPTSG